VPHILELIKIMNSLSDPNRYTIIKELLNRDYCVGGLALKLDISEAAVSQHLNILKDAGLITGEKRGYFKHYKVNQEILKKVSIELNAMSETKRESLAQCPPTNKNDCPLCRQGLINDKKLEY
jgi:DNA-binding transcriptional ArsR family regulator